jgi:hypothetical protein
MSRNLPVQLGELIGRRERVDITATFGHRRTIALTARLRADDGPR